MELIDKSAVVAEIERLKNFYDHFDDNIQSVAKYNVLVDVLSFLNTLEVKEVKCEMEIGIYTTKELLKKRNHSTGVFHLTQSDIDSIAKHFYELGLKARKENK